MPPVNQPYVVFFYALAKSIGAHRIMPHDDALKYIWDYLRYGCVLPFFFLQATDMFFACKSTLFIK
jgi:hypothetical protein